MTASPAWPAFTDAMDRLREHSQSLARLIADTLTGQFDGAAYLILEHDEHDEFSCLHSVLAADGRTLFPFADRAVLPALAEDSPLRGAWGQLDPADPRSLLMAAQGLHQARAVFDDVPDDLPCEDITDDHTCLLLSAEARPGCWLFGWDFDGEAAGRLVRPYSAPRPPALHRGAPTCDE